MKTLYLAGPITGLTFADAAAWRRRVANQLPGWRCLSPLRGKEHLDTGVPLPDSFDGGAAAVEQDLADILRADAMLVNFGGACDRASIGTAAEIGFACRQQGESKIPLTPRPYILVVLGDNNVHDHVFVHYMADQIVTNLGDAIQVLKRWRA